MSFQKNLPKSFPNPRTKRHLSMLTGAAALHPEAAGDVDAPVVDGDDERAAVERDDDGPAERARVRGVDEPAGGRLRGLQHGTQRHDSHRM